LWARCLDEGDIPGPYWALITHPSSSRKVVWNAFGHVHMLSHLVGASNRADIRKLKALEDERETLIEDLITAKRRLAEGEIDMRTLMQQHADEVRDLDLQLSLARKAESRLEIAERHIRDLEGGEIVRSQQSRLDELGRRLATEAERRESATIRCAALNRELEDLRRVNEALTQIPCRFVVLFMQRS